MATGREQYSSWFPLCAVLLLLAGCFSAPPPLPPHEALARTAQRIQQILDEERKLLSDPVRFPESAANPHETAFWYCSHPLISHALLAHPERVAAFRSAHPACKFDLQYIGDWSVAIQKLTVAIAAGDVPDVALVKRGWFARLADSGWAAPLDDLLPRELIDDFRPVAIDSLKRNGRLYALPADGFCSVLFYNKEKLGPPCPPSTPGHQPPPITPSTWNDLRQRARELSKPGEDPQKTVYALGHLPYLETIWSAGGDICDETRCLLDSEAARESLDFLLSLRTDGLAHPRVLADCGGALALFLSGRLAMTVAGSEYMPQIRNAQFPIGIAPVPGKNGPVSRQSDDVLVVFAKHAHAKRAAIASLLDFLTGPAVQDQEAFQNGSAPTRKSLMKDAPLPEGIDAAYNLSRNTPLVSAWSAIAFELDAGLGRCLAP
ncbi:MAG TPA: extracellular solute-binding protein [Candidatus Hydrogenedentes bacterium]|nr:extracellular solute-binding protein [Candidatus Hydrogenedentota bacterium]HOV74247.1 extracellular solute-binding protein [Candidatus Hydrogenedentota bacterium]HPC15059.1 extracellular solute-binding protein [Candidatus Hydrogenedentota bacterium]HRT19080.1 extracellular solute-binding protein [Candidatus Hydrogenedentota bacterium]HRT64009.1 extracellular solute-binding protein [Candidatus Hydrogenedentota bacterium]